MGSPTGRRVWQVGRGSWLSQIEVPFVRDPLRRGTQIKCPGASFRALLTSSSPRQQLTLLRSGYSAPLRGYRAC